ncbi:MAG: Zn-dependent hydrolase [Parcubacteria group bacterium CG23_combo_of_CG06-09_8_20_14_all_35_6]|nr:MAG: Zn-dependent hydrolase [Parcubacteria group bacterium CG23_combo_of_CG06-09_8_20_14_all_35_6]
MSAVKSNRVIYIDPYQINETEKADIILITHGHFDHCSLPDIQRISKPETVIVATPDCQSRIASLSVEFRELKIAQPGISLEIKGVRIETVPAYNTDKHFHPKEDELVGYIINLDSRRIYHAGDTDLIPEMKNIKNIDVALLPIGGTYTMNAEEAAEAVKIINPKAAVPMHYGSVVGSDADAARFKGLVGEKAVVMEEGVNRGQR